MIKYEFGTILAPPKDVNVLVHGCNCFHKMESGVAKVLKNQWPIIAEMDKTMTAYGDKEKLGSILAVEISPQLTIINAYTQYEYGTDTPKIDYAAFEKAMNLVYDNFSAPWFTIAMPKIGAGLAGGDWNILEGILKKVFHDIDIYVILKTMDLYQNIKKTV